MAAGTQPNTVAAREDATHFTVDGKYFGAVDEAGNAVKPERSAKPAETHVLLAHEADGRTLRICIAGLPPRDGHALFCSVGDLSAEVRTPARGGEDTA